ncbi:hypothetical protein BN406_06094 (plasmid) [Sinorhizobium meliloti Rm41]|nr:hypothetical protein BN406_06094 [Sinorhizobium meliloti Rm41]
MNDLTNGDFGRYADLYRPLKNSSETFCTPALTDTGQRRMVRGSNQRNSDTNLSLAYQPAVMNNPKKKACKHQPDCNFRINAGSTKSRRRELILL